MLWLIALALLWILSVTGSVGGNAWYWGGLIALTPVVVLYGLWEIMSGSEGRGGGD